MAVYQLHRKRKGVEIPPFSDATVPYIASPVGPDLGTCEQLLKVLEAWDQGRSDFPSLLAEYVSHLHT